MEIKDFCYMTGPNVDRILMFATKWLGMPFGVYIILYYYLCGYVYYIMIYEEWRSWNKKNNLQIKTDCEIDSVVKTILIETHCTSKRRILKRVC